MVVGLIVVGIGAFLLLNLETSRPARSPSSASAATGAPAAAPTGADPVDLAGSGARNPEYPIGDQVERNHLQIAAVWLHAITMDNMPPDPSMHPIHIEADIKATENNPNGFALHEKVAYLKVGYQLVPVSGGAAIASGELSPMMARDGFHYGATIAMPAPGQYQLVYAISSPAAGGLGRHSDPATGVAPWWEPFEVSFDWTVEPEPAPEVSLR